MRKIIVITGPTGVGKTKLSILLSKKYNGEVINADSMQIYKGLNIGTAKIEESEKEGISHHLFDIKDVLDDYSIYDYQRDGRRVIQDILKRGKTVFVVGGSGLYIKSLLYDYKLDDNSNYNNYDSYNDIKTEDLYDALIDMDKSSLGVIDKHNRRRIINAINYYKQNKESITKNTTNTMLYDCIFIGLTTDRGKLYDIINKRVDDMVDRGLIEEAFGFFKRGIYTKPLLGGIGYKELYQYFEGKISLEEAILKIKQNSRHYAKRQYTFFNNQLPIKWFSTDYDCFDNTLDEVSRYIDSCNEEDVL